MRRRTLLLLVALLLGALSCLQLAPSPLKYRSPVPTIIVVGDKREGGDFGDPVFQTIRKLQDAAQDPDQFHLEEIDDARQAGASISASAAKSTVAGIIVASTSDRAAPVLEICQALGLPTAVVVATHNELINEDMPMVRRMVPNDSEQGHAASQWLAKPPTTCALFYEPGVYGKGIADTVVEDRPDVLRFRLESPLGFGALTDSLDAGARSFIFAGYANDVRDALQKLDSLCRRRHIRVSALVTDGAYKVFSAPPKLEGINLSLSFPTDQKKESFASLATASVGLFLKSYRTAASTASAMALFDREAKREQIMFKNSERIGASFSIRNAPGRPK